MILWYVDPGNGYTFLNTGAWLLAVIAGIFGFLNYLSKGLFRFAKNNKKPLLIVLIIIILLGFSIKGVFMMRHVSKFNNKIIILGFDALSPEIIEPMIQQGMLPNFARLQVQGSYSKLSTTNPAQSPVAWAGFATGKNPGKNGIFDFIERDPKNYHLDLVFSRMKKGRPINALKAKGFWDYTSSLKVPTVVLACPDTFPADKVYGKMLSGMGVPDILGTEGTFTFYTSEKLTDEKEYGGKVFHVNKNPAMVMNFIGPRVKGINGSSENVVVPVQLTLENNGKVIAEYQKNKVELEVGRWSSWNEIEFDLGSFKKCRGIFKFYLVETNPEFKLYISPINFDPRQPFFQISYPYNYSGELAGNIGLYYTQGMPMDVWAVNENRLSERVFLQQAEDVLKERKAMLDFELSRLDKGVLFCYFESVDIIQHMFWRYIDAEHPLYKRDTNSEYKGEIARWYKKMDGILGDVLNKLKPEDTLIVISDHGFGTFKRAVHLNSWLRKKGYLVLKDPRAASGQELLADVDWLKTKAYALGFGGIYLNQRKRESQGIVEPGIESNNLKKTISKELEKWIDDELKQRVVKKVYLQENVFHGIYAKDAPDLYVGFNVGYRASWQTAVGAAPESLLEDNLKKWSGDHLFDPSLVPGLIFSNKKIIKNNPSIYDVAPTILKITGYSEDQIEGYNFDGTALF